MSFKNFNSQIKAEKTPKSAGKKPFSSRTVIGVVCIIMALAVTFGIAPLVNRFADQKVDIVRLKTDIERGSVISEADIETVNVGAYNLPDNVIKDKNYVIGKYAAADLFAGDYIFESKLSDDNKSADDVLGSLDGKKVAVSVAIGNFENALSSKIENGDIVSVIVYDKEHATSYIPEELKYVRVVTVTSPDGVDIDKAESGTKFETVTVLATAEQAERLAYFKSTTDVHFALVYRGDEAMANEYIKVQDAYLASHPIDNTPKKEADNG